MPKEGAGWEMEAIGHRQGHQEPRSRAEAGRLDGTKEANEHLRKYYAIVGYPGIARRAAELSGRMRSQAMVKNDFGWMANERERILAEWTKRYDGKSAPK